MTHELRINEICVELFLYLIIQPFIHYSVINSVINVDQTLALKEYRAVS